MLESKYLNLSFIIHLYVSTINRVVSFIVDNYVKKNPLYGQQWSDKGSFIDEKIQNAL